MAQILISDSLEKTKKFAKEFSEKLSGGEVIGLVGDLGSGKTTFVQSIAKRLGIKEKVKSPTFNILKKYSVINHGKIKNFYHLDLYRTNSLDFVDLKEISAPDSVIFIEWAEKIISFLPKDWIKVEFEYVDENKRRILISN